MYYNMSTSSFSLIFIHKQIIQPAAGYTKLAMDVALQFISKINSENKREVLTILLAAIAFITFPFVICALVVSGTANAGFNVVFTALLNCGFLGAAHHVVNNSKTPIAIGFLLGSSGMLAILNFMTAIYWGNLSHCKIYKQSFNQYSCSSPVAYGFVCFFAVCIFLAEAAFCAGTYIWRGELISEEGVYESVPSRSAMYEAPRQLAPQYSHAASVDL